MTAFAPSNLVEVTSAPHFQELLSQDLNRVSLLNFWAPWAEPCKQMNKVVWELARKFPNLLVLQVEAEEQGDISDSFDIEAVPSCVVLRGHTLLAKIDGADASKLTDEIARHMRVSHFGSAKTDRSPVSPAAGETQEELNARLHKLMRMAPVTLFMKGTPDAPRCGFSRQTVALLRELGTPFSHFDILQDESVRQGLKVLNDWPTFPQIIVNGELIGGLDIFKEMVESGEFQQMIAV